MIDVAEQHNDGHDFSLQVVSFLFGFGFCPTLHLNVEQFKGLGSFLSFEQHFSLHDEMLSQGMSLSLDA